jgi:tetratricopeptide (TPR) repeat protein
MPYLILLLALVALGPSAVWAQTPAATAGPLAADEIGSDSVTFATSCAPAVATRVNEAVALLHSFWFPEAIKAFEAVAAADPDCAIAHWGIALSQWGNPFAGLKTAQVVERGAATIARARATGTPTPRERGLIDAVAILYSSTDPITQRERLMKYEAAMGRLAAEYPGDAEIQIFHALALTQAALPTDKTYSMQLRAARILDPLWEKMPRHPGLAHYMIHSYDAPPLAARGLDPARRYASLAPSVPHALHMPSHTFTRVGSWKESIETNRRSADAARRSGGIGEELHALDYQTYAYLQTAQDAAAKAAVERGATIASQPGANTFAVAAMPARYALERGDWAAAAALTVTAAPATPYTEALTHFARAIGASRSGRPDAASADIARLAEVRDRLTKIPDPYWAEQVDIQRRVALAWQAYAQGRRDDGIAQLIAAADAEDLTDKASVTPGPLAPARELLGEMLLDAGRPREALVAFEATMRKEPNRFRGLYGGARAAAAAGDKDKAARYYRDLLAIAADSDTPRPELVEARGFAR